MANKKTQKDLFNELLAIDAVKENQELVDFINGRLEILAKKNASGAETETQKENKALGVNIVDYIKASDTEKTISEISKHFDKTSQKITPIMKSLVEDGTLAVRVEKRTSYYSVA